MKELKQELYLLCDEILRHTSEYSKELAAFRSDDVKALISRHYSYASQLLRYVSRLDEITLRVSLTLTKSDTQEKLDSIKDLEKLLDVCLEYRKTIEGYFTECEMIIKSKESSMPHKLRQQTDIFSRKTFSVGNSVK